MKTLKYSHHRINGHAVVGITKDGLPRCSTYLDIPSVSLLEFYRDKEEHLKKFKDLLGEDIDSSSITFSEPTPGQYGIGLMISVGYTLKTFPQGSIDDILKKEDQILDKNRRIEEIDKQISLLQDKRRKIRREK